MSQKREFTAFASAHDGKLHFTVFEGKPLPHDERFGKHRYYRRGINLVHVFAKEGDIDDAQILELLQSWFARYLLGTKE